MIKVMTGSLAIMLGFFCSFVWAEGGAYQIELIVFSQAMPNTEGFEQMSSQIIWPTGLTELSTYKKAETATLDDAYAALLNDSTYQPILRVAWAQSDLNVPVHVQSSDGRLNGYLQLQQDSGLQMMVDLEFTANPGEIVYRLTEKRSVKFNEVYYLDHPKFGVVAKISSF